jgi:hypothetical protein
MASHVQPTPEPAEGSIEHLRTIFHSRDMLLLNEFQMKLNVLQFIRTPFSDDFAERYSDVLPLLTENEVVYSDNVEDWIYGEVDGATVDPLLLDLVQMRRRRETRQLEDGTRTQHAQVETAF